MTKQIFSAVLLSAALGFASCEKNEAGNPVGSFKAFSEVSTSAKTHLEPDVASHAFRVKWDRGDEIKIYDDNTGYSATYSTRQNDVEAATFTVTSGSGVAAGSYYTAFYPATLATDYNSGSYNVTLPATQQYKAIRTDAGGGYYGYVTDFPMVASTMRIHIILEVMKSSGNDCKNSSGDDLYFKNLCGLCVLRLKGPSGATVSSITLSEPTYPYTTATALSGTFKVRVNWRDGTPTLVKETVSARQDSVQLSGCNVALDDDSYHLFYFYLPQGSHKWLNVKVNYSFGGTDKSFSRTVLASSYGGAANISFTRSRWTALDVDLSTEMNNTPNSINSYYTNSINEGYRLIYAADNLVFSGDNAPILNTNHRITDVAQRYTILIDATPSVLSGDGTSTNPCYYTLYNDMDASGKGIVIRYRKAYGEDWAINAEGPHATANDKLVFSDSYVNGFTVAAGVRNRIAVVIEPYSSSYYLFATSSNDGSTSWSAITRVSGTMTRDNWLADDPYGYVRAVIGGDQSDVDDSDQSIDANQLKHNFQGTIHSIRIYNREITEDELENWFSSGSVTGPGSK